MRLNVLICSHSDPPEWDESIYNFKHAKVEFSNPVRVYNDSDQLIGQASLYRLKPKSVWQSPCVIANISLSWDTQERVTFTEGQGHWIVPVGSLDVCPDESSSQRGRLNMLGSAIRVSSIRIRHLIMTTTKSYGNRVTLDFHTLP